MDNSDSLKALAALYPLTLYLQCRLDVLEATFALTHDHDTRIGDKTVGDFLKQALRDRLHDQLAKLSDSDPALATEFLRILRDEAGIEL
jgi:hypothetical protein